MNRIFCFCFFMLFCFSAVNSYAISTANSSAISTVNTKTMSPAVVLLSIDGFAYDYLHKHQPPNLIALSKNSVLAKLQSVYPSKTFPNHLSIITGDYPINHGIMHNAFYNPDLAQHYKLGGGKTNSAWLKAKPLWTIAQQQGLKSAVYFWPESEAINNEPTYNIPYNRSDSNKKRFDQIINWLKLPTEERPHFIVSYFSRVDSAGHVFGPDSKEVIEAIAEIDLLIGDFIATLKTEIPFEVNLIIVSDHGMIQKDLTKKIKPSMVFDSQTLALIQDKKIIVASSDTQLYLYFSPDYSNPLARQKIIHHLKTGVQTVDNKNLYHVYSKGSYPKHWQLNGNSSLIPDLIVDVLPPVTFIKENTELHNVNKGTHGYDPLNQKSLLGIFIATGPDIVKSEEILTFENIHIFPFLSELLSIPNNERINEKSEKLIPFIRKTKDTVQ